MIKVFRDKLGRSKIPLAKSRLFWAGLFIKCGISAFFASSFMRELFAPFADYFIQTFGDPYAHFSRYGTGNEFPYPPLMLWLFSLPRMLASPFLPVTPGIFTLADSMLYRVPLLVSDFVILLILMRWLKAHTRQVLIWYWLSPVLIYINYFHGQLDVIPMAWMMASLYFLFKSRWNVAFLLTGFAVACKTNMALVLPFSIIYMYRNSSGDLLRTFTSLLFFVVAVLCINLPYMHSQGFIQMVYNNPVQQQIFDLFYRFNDELKIYFIPAVYFILVVYYLSFRFVNRDQLILFLTFTFLALTLMIAPMQGWYYWILPLLVYFTVKQGTRGKMMFVLLSVLYFIYFGLINESDYTNSYIYSTSPGGNPAFFIHNDKWLNIAFTILQTTLGLTGLIVYKYGIGTNIQAKFLSQPYLLGIGGDSASGKSTLTSDLVAIFGKKGSSIIRGDDMHRWERGDENWKNITHLDPKANKLHEEMEHARSLKSGKSIRRRKYDHATGRFTLPTFIKPNKLIIFEGLHSFYLSNQSAVYDLKIFMEPDENLRMWWKVRRDVEKRGYSPAEVLEQLSKREKDSEKYIRTQAAQADIIASFYPLREVNPTDQDTVPEIGLRIRLTNDLNPDPLVEMLRSCDSLQTDYRYESAWQEIILSGNITAERIDYMAAVLVPGLEEIGIYQPVWKNDYEGLMQLITVYVIFEKLKVEQMA